MENMEIEDSKEDKKEHWDDRWGRRLGLAVLMFFGILILGSIAVEMKPKGQGWILFFAFVSIPAVFTGLVERVWRNRKAPFERFKSDKDFRRLVYGLVVITYLGCWAVYLVGSMSINPSQPVKFDVNLTSPLHGPIRIDVQNTHTGSRPY